jgi:cold-inducible RNA-binding protein
VGNKIFVGNLPWRVTSDDLVAMLDEMGHPHRSARVVLDRDTGRSRGFAFVEFGDDQEASDAARDLDGHVVDGRPLRAREADDRPRSGGAGRGGRSRRGRGGGGGGRDAEFDVWR